MIQVNSLFRHVRLGQDNPGHLVVTLLFVSFGALGGALIAFGGLYLNLAIIGLPLLLMVASTHQVLIWSTVVGGVVISGLADLYFPSLGPIRWVISMSGFVLLGLSIIILLFQKNGVPVLKNAGPDKMVLIWLGIFLLIILFSGSYNRVPGAAFAAGVKGYIQFWGVLVAFVAFKLTRSQADRLIDSLLLLALIQLPFALHQFIFLAPLRASTSAAQDLVVAVDVVVGTFTASESGGGASSVLALLQVTVVALLASRWKDRLLSGKMALLLSFICLFPLFLNETKVTFIFLAIVVGVVFRGEIIKAPSRFLLVLISSLVIIFAMFLTYNFLLPKGQASQTTSEYLSAIVESNAGAQGYGKYRLNRLGSIIHWGEENLQLSRIDAALIGYGPGSARSSSIGGISPLQRRYFGEGVDLTGISVLLWEGGLLGLGAVCGMLWRAFHLAKRLSESGTDAKARASGVGLQAAVLMLFINLFHNNYIAFEVGFQTLMMVIVGYLAYSASICTHDSQGTVRVPA